MSNEAVIKDISGDDVPEITEIESLCFNCKEQGVTRLLLTRIPFFRDVVVSSFTCEHCGFENRHLDSVGDIADKGVKYTLHVEKPVDLNRRIVLGKGCAVGLPHLDATFPILEGTLSTVEGSITKIIENIEVLQSERREQQPEVAAKLDEFVLKLQDLLEIKEPFIFVLDDPSGNSYLENYHAPTIDPQLREFHYQRTKEQDESVGLFENNANEDNEVADENEPFNAKGEVFTFSVDCPNCRAPCESNMKVLDIPHFKEVVVMATVCSTCGHRENEVKGGCGIAPQGRKITLRLTSPHDLTRDLLKSDTAAVMVPELELEAVAGTLSGRFTTVEGILTAIKDQLSKSCMFNDGDSALKARDSKMVDFLGKLDKVITGETLNVHLVLDDPAGNSFLQNLNAPEKDPEMTIEDYDRTFEQNDLLGLNDMRTENYE